MISATFIDPATDPRKAYEALLASLHRMCAQDPMALIENGGASPDLLPAPNAVVRGSGFIAFTALADYDTLPGQSWTVQHGDTLVIEPGADYGPGDTLLVSALDDELVLVGVRQDGSFCWMARIEDDYEPQSTLVLGVVMEVRKGRGAKPAVPNPTPVAKPSSDDLFHTVFGAALEGRGSPFSFYGLGDYPDAVADFTADRLDKALAMVRLGEKWDEAGSHALLPELNRSDYFGDVLSDYVTGTREAGGEPGGKAYYFGQLCLRLLSAGYLLGTWQGSGR